MKSFTLIAIFVLAVLPAAAARGLSTVEEAMDRIVSRIYETVEEKDLNALTEDAILKTITPEEREVLATRFWSFEVNVPAIVSVVRGTGQQTPPFWLAESGFEKTDLRVVNEEGWEYEVWQKRFDAGPVGLGINGFDRQGASYFVTVGPQNPDDDVEITNLHPDKYPLAWMGKGAYTYNDWETLYLDEVPRELVGHRLLTSIRGRGRETHLLAAFRKTPHPSSCTPDQVILTWSEDPRTTQTVQWRTNLEREKGVVRYKKKGSEKNMEAEAARDRIEDRMIVNDRSCHHYTAVLRDLEPNTAYTYSVGDPDGEWSKEAEFTTAPDEGDKFSFLYFGDAHQKPGYGELLDLALERHPEAAFIALAGDMVNTGQHRDHWDQFFHVSRNGLNRRPMVPTIGNHEVIDGLGVEMYVDLLALPENGPDTLQAERAYWFEYANALFVIPDSCSFASDQAAWIEEQLAGSDATWKFAMYHFPPYNYDEPYPEIRSLWGYLFDKYHLDFSLEGHIHYYMRSRPMRRDRPVASPKDGTIHIVSIPIANRQLDLPPVDYAATQITGIPLYQVFEIDGNRLSYKVLDLEGYVHDELVVEK